MGGDRAGRCGGCGSGPVLRAHRLGVPGLRVLGPGRRPWARPRAAKAVHARHALADGGAVLHAADAAAGHPARAGHRRRAARLRRPGACARLPAARRRGDRRLALRRARLLRQPGLPLSRASVHRCDRRLPDRDDPAGALHRPHAAYPCEGAGRGDPPAHHPGLLPRHAGRERPRPDLSGRPRDAASIRADDAWRGRFDFVLAPA